MHAPRMEVPGYAQYWKQRLDDKDAVSLGRKYYFGMHEPSDGAVNGEWMKGTFSGIVKSEAGVDLGGYGL